VPTLAALSECWFEVVTTTSSTACQLCDEPGGTVVWAHDEWRVVRVLDIHFPAYYRLISQAHLVEFSSLTTAAREHCMRLVCAIERTLMDEIAPIKVNLAALGNIVPHLHWHVVARFTWDSHFPQPIWGLSQRTLASPAASQLACGLDQLDAAVAQALSSTV
jgi:diadenosine tetraphosphate (Ap4A) HIT family hydrolase